MRAGILGLIAACSAPARPAAPSPVAPPPAPDLAVAEPPARQPSPPPVEHDPTDPRWLIQKATRDVVVVGPREVIFERRLPLAIDVADSDMWSPCVRELWQAQSPPVRRALGAAFRRYTTSCDSEGRVVISPPSEYRGAYVAFVGTFADLSVSFVACGASGVDHVVLAYDGKRWTSGHPVEDRRDGCTVASLPAGKSLRRALRDAIDARDATVVFDGGDDLPITDDMKRDLRAMLDAIDALNP